MLPFHVVAHSDQLIKSTTERSPDALQMSRSCDARPGSGPGTWWPLRGTVASIPSAANGRRELLDVVDAGQYADPEASIQRPVGHTYLPGQEMSEHRFDLPVVVLRKGRIGGRARPVSHHQDRHLFPGEPAFGGSTAPLPL